MANELQIDYPTGANLYAYLLNSTGLIWNGIGFEAPVNANWATYAIAMTQSDTTGIYRGDMPSVAVGYYSFVVRLRAGGAPAVGDVGVGGESFEWDGSAVVGSTAAAVWSYATRTLTQSAASVVAAVEGSIISVYNYTTWVIALTGLGDISARASLYFTAKERLGGTDDANVRTIVQLEETIGLIYIGGEAAANPAMGTLVVNDAVAGNITITVDETVTGFSSRDGQYDVKVLTVAGAANVLTISTFHVLDVATRAII